MSIHNKKHFCFAPFITKRYFFDNFSVCPGEERDHFLFNDNEITGKKFEDILNSEKYNKIRKNFISGNGEHSMCKTCIQFTDLGFGLVREFFYNNFSHDAEQILKNVSEDGSIIDTNKLNFLAVTFDNTCNLKCRFCDAERSSLILKEALPWSKINYDVNYSMSEDNFRKVIEDSKKADFLQFTSAGEPFINEKLYILLDELIRTNNTDKTLMFYTNCTTIKFKNYDAIAMLSKFKKVLLFASIDGLGKHNKIIRHNLVNFSKIKNNLISFSKIPNITITVHPTLSIYNFYNLPLIHKFFIKHKIIEHNNFNFIPVFNDDLSVTNLPISIKNLAISNFYNHIKWLEKNNFADKKNLMGKTPIELYKSAISYIKFNSSFSLNEIKKRVLVTDTIRKVNSKNLKEIQELFNANE